MENKNKSSKTNTVITYRTPIYLQLREIVRNRIEDGEYLPGMAIPSENELAETFGINRITVRNALDALVNEGMLQRVQGKGVFVLGNKHEEVLEEHGGFVSNLMGGKVSSSVKEQVKSLRPAGDKFSSLFEIDPEDPIYYIRHLTLAAGEPIALEEIYVPQDICPQLDAVNTSVFEMRDVFAFYDVEMCSMRQSLEIINGLPKIRKALDVPDEVSLIMMECTYRDKTGRVIEFSRSFFRGDKASFRISLIGN